MRIEYICHSCLFIDTGDTTLLFDPWLKGTAYHGQWQLFPPPVSLSMLPRVRNILYSHGHEDHLHRDSLLALPNDAHVFYPYQWRRGAKEYFAENGFHELTEAVSLKAYRVSPTTTVTYIGFALESLIVIETNGIVIVNINDALNSHHQNVVEFFLQEIKKRWPKIDYLFSGWSGAGYFPNTVHYKTKDDREIGLIREQYFGHQFCRIVRRLQPTYAVPFAPGFALLRPERRWINEVKFPRETLQSYYAQHFSANDPIEFFNTHPGDYFDENGFHAVSEWHDRYAQKPVAELIAETYAEESTAAEQLDTCSEAEASALLPLLDHWVNQNSQLFDAIVLQEAKFALQIEGLEQNPFFNFRFREGKFVIERSQTAAADTRLLLRTRAVLLAHALNHDWGGDVLTIGYGVDVDIYDEPALEQNLDIVCVRLLTRYPTTSSSLKKDPIRALSYFIRHPLMSKLAIRQKLMLRNTVNKFPYNERDHWISWSKCDLCKVCDLPELSFRFGEQLGVIT